jgi:hypothetical protein
MIINYSIYGLNTNNMGMWIKSPFTKKNDGYQMPIVMNPYRHRMEILTLILKLI